MNSKSTGALIAIALATAAGLVIYPQLATEPPEPPTAPAAQLAEELEPAPEAPALAGVVSPEPTVELVEKPRNELDPELRLEFPDGSYLPTLNGALNPSPVRWPKGHPFSPVVRTERDPKGNDWYVHANGFRTTTIMGWRGDLGRYDSTTRVAQPGKARDASRGARVRQ